MSTEQIKPGYKRTEVGVIPEDWNTRQLGEIAQLKNGFSFLSKNYTPLGNFKIITIANVQDGYMIADACNKISILPRELQSHQHLRCGEILISMTGNVGRTCRVIEDNCLLNQRVGKLVSTGIDENLLFFLLCQRKFVAAMVGKAKGGAQGNLSKTDIEEYIFPLPSRLPEQRAIATVLLDVDALLTKLDQLIAKKRDLKQATTQQLLTGQTRLPGFSGEWEVKRLGEMATLKNGYTFKSETYSPLGCYKVITIANVQDGYMVLDDCNSVDKTPPDIQPHQLLKVGDILISMTGNVGRICRVSEDFCLLNQRVGKLIPNLVQDDFLFALLRQPSFIVSMSAAAKGGAQPNLSAADIGGYEFSIPADATEQTAIANILSDMDAELAGLETRRDKALALKQGMMQELLTGRVRLV